MPSWRDEPTRLARSWTAFRQVSPQWPPLFHAAGAPRAVQPGGRWNELGGSYAQYFALDPMGAWAELVRFEHIRSAMRAEEYRRTLWVAYIDERDIADLSSWDRYVACGLDPRLAIGDHAASRALAQELRAAGFRGLLSPSAALPNAVNLTLFGERYERVLTGGLEDYRNPRPGEFVPCTKAALGSPPAELITESVFIGARHAGYEEWAAAAGAAAP